MAVNNAASAEATPQDGKLGPDAYKKLYPAEFYKRFIENGIRPDGRNFGSGRPVTIGLRPIEGPASSALIKIGNTSVLAGLTFEILPSTGETITKGELEVTVNVTALSLGSLDRRKAAESSQVLSLQTQQVLDTSGAMDLTKLASKSKKAALKASLDLHVLDADGAVQDACLLAASSTLASLRASPFSSIQENADEDVEMLDEGSNEADVMDGFCQVNKLSIVVTIGLYGEHLIVDPTHEEESLMDGCASIALDSHGSVSGFDATKPAHIDGIPTLKLIEIVEAAKLRQKDILQLLQQTLQDSSS